MSKPVRTITLFLFVLSLFLGAGIASAEEGQSSCASTAVDLTDPSFLLVEASANGVSRGSTTESFTDDGTKISIFSGFFETIDRIPVGTKVTCKATCTGNNCRVNGCDASSSGCTACQCTGGSSCSACTCVKTSVYIPDPITKN